MLFRLLARGLGACTGILDDPTEPMNSIANNLTDQDVDKSRASRKGAKKRVARVILDTPLLVAREGSLGP